MERCPRFSRTDGAATHPGLPFPISLSIRRMKAKKIAEAQEHLEAAAKW